MIRAARFTGTSHGISLIEVLVALLVLAIGLLTVAGLTLFSRKANLDATQRTTAALLAHDLAERMRANTARLDEYVAMAAAGLPGSRSIPPPNPSCTSDASRCTAAQLATFDLYRWEQALVGAAETAADTGANAGGLVNPTGCIAGPAGGGSGSYAIAIAYRGAQALSNPRSSGCGERTGRYGDHDEYRRVVVLNTYIEQ